MTATTDSLLDTLSPAERAVLDLVFNGASNKDIAKALGISMRTAEARRASCCRKLGATNTATMIRAAIRHGMQA